MSSTPFKILNKETDFSFFTDTFHLEINRNAPDDVLSSSRLLPGAKTTGRILNLVSDFKKIFIAPTGIFFHMFSDTVGPLLQQYALDSNVEIVIDTSVLSNQMFVTGDTKFNKDTFTGFFIDALVSKGISVTLFDRNNYDYINLNNFYINDFQFYVGDTYSDMFNLFKEQVIPQEAVPYRYTYLSRKAVQSDHNRVDDESVLESYFSGLGYEIIYPEDFVSFPDQLRYMYSVKVLVALSGSGLLNSVFMQPGQTVVEILTPLIIPLGNTENPYKSSLIEDLHHFYSVMCFKKSHLYMAVDNKERKAVDVISKIENNHKLKQLLSSVE